MERDKSCFNFTSQANLFVRNITFKARSRTMFRLLLLVLCFELVELCLMLPVEHNRTTDPVMEVATSHFPLALRHVPLWLMCPYFSLFQIEQFIKKLPLNVFAYKDNNAMPDTRFIALKHFFVFYFMTLHIC